jgi:hypothetical protein
VLKKDNDRVMESVLHGTGLQRYQRITQKEMRERVGTKHAQVLAFSESRDLSLPAKIMRPDEVYVRARREMNPDASTIIDCTRVHYASCQDVALELAMSDFREVAVAGINNQYISPCGGR